MREEATGTVHWHPIDDPLLGVPVINWPLDSPPGWYLVEFEGGAKFCAHREEDDQ